MAPGGRGGCSICPPHPSRPQKLLRGGGCTTTPLFRASLQRQIPPVWWVFGVSRRAPKCVSQNRPGGQNQGVFGVLQPPAQRAPEQANPPVVVGFGALPRAPNLASHSHPGGQNQGVFSVLQPSAQCAASLSLQRLIPPLWWVLGLQKLRLQM